MNLNRADETVAVDHLTGTFDATMAIKRLRILAASEACKRAFLFGPTHDRHFVYFTGPGSTQWACVNCGHVLIRGRMPPMVSDGGKPIGLRCTSCGALLEAPDTMN